MRTLLLASGIVLALGTVLPWYGLYGRSASLWGDFGSGNGVASRAAMAALIVLLSLPAIAACLVSFFRTPNTEPNLSPVQGGFVMVAASIAALLVMINLSPPSSSYGLEVTVQWGAILSLLAALVATGAAAYVWRIMTVSQTAMSATR